MDYKAGVRPSSGAATSDRRDVSVFANALVQSNEAVAEDGHAPGLVMEIRRTAGVRPPSGAATSDRRDVSVFANALIQSNDAVAEDGHAPGLVIEIRGSSGQDLGSIVSTNRGPQNQN